MEHWRASEQGDSAAEHAIYAPDAILDYPQSGERFRSRATLAAQRGGHPADRHFTVRFEGMRPWLPVLRSWFQPPRSQFSTAALMKAPQDGLNSRKAD